MIRNTKLLRHDEKRMSKVLTMVTYHKEKNEVAPMMDKIYTLQEMCDYLPVATCHYVLRAHWTWCGPPFSFQC